jgi:predicted nucleic acid-binding protein
MLNQPPPATIYLDTSAVVAAMFEEHVHFALSSGLIAQLVAAGSQIQFSQILWLELSQVLAQLPRDPALSPTLRRIHRLHRWDADAQIRERWLAAGQRRFYGVIGPFADVTVVPFTRPIC